MRKWNVVLGLLLSSLIGCAEHRDDVSAAPTQSAQPASTKPASKPNFIILIGDDMGVETLSSYGIGDVTANTPNLDRLATSGVQFQNFWVQPTCSPTRATLLTGRYGFRTGVLQPGYPRLDLIDAKVPEAPTDAPTELRYSPRGYIPQGTHLDPPSFMDFTKPPRDGLPPDEVTLPQMLKSLPEAYATAAVGKWHLADARNGWLSAPNEAGFDYYSGLIMGETDSYRRWLHVSQGVPSGETGYIDERTVADGVDWIKKQATQDNPWLLWVAFVNPHTPITLPPKRLLKSDAALALTEEGLTPDNTQPYAMAMIEAMDTLIEQLLSSVPESERDNTYIFFMGDNGSVEWAQPAKPVDASRTKMSVYEGGIRVPFMVSGPGIPKGKQTEALANSVDLMATVLELAGADMADLVPVDKKIDSQSLASVLEDPSESGPRKWIYADTRSFITRSYDFAIRDNTFKLVERNGKQELFNLIDDPWEEANLNVEALSSEHRQALGQLNALAESLRATK